MAWSEKPPGLDYLQPSVTHFSLGKTKPFKGDLNQPGVLKAMLEVPPCPAALLGVLSPSLHMAAGTLWPSLPWFMRRLSAAKLCIPKTLCIPKSSPLPAAPRSRRPRPGARAQNRSCPHNHLATAQHAVQARSYKKEVVYFCMAGTGVADIGLNFLFNLRDLGYDHWVAFANNEGECDRLEAAVGNAGETGVQGVTAKT